MQHALNHISARLSEGYVHMVNLMSQKDSERLEAYDPQRRIPRNPCQAQLGMPLFLPEIKARYMTSKVGLQFWVPHMTRCAPPKKEKRKCGYGMAASTGSVVIRIFTWVKRMPKKRRFVIHFVCMGCSTCEANLQKKEKDNLMSRRVIKKRNKSKYFWVQSLWDDQQQH